MKINIGGKGKMPAFAKRLTEGEVAALATYGRMLKMISTDRH